jgi:RimJ/RimL family protein N-acetyltransferase
VAGDRTERIHVVSDIQTDRLVLHPIGLAEARRIYDRAPDGADRWADAYPFDDELDALTLFIDSVERDGDPQPFGLYQVRLDGVAVGGIGFFGAPDDGEVEVGFGLIEDVRGHGYAAEALEAVVELAMAFGATAVIADTALDNLASQRTMLNAGMREASRDDDKVSYRID